MKNLQIIKNTLREIICDVWCGSSFSSTVEEAKTLSKLNKRIVRFDFNGVCIRVNEYSDNSSLYRDFCNAISFNLFKVVGPYSAKEYKVKLKNKIDKLTIERDEKNRIDQEKYRVEQENKKKDLLDKIGNVELELINESEYLDWKNENTDSYGNACFVYAEYWMRLMQRERDNGNYIQNCITKTSHEADIEGITGFMFGCAKQIVRKCWKYADLITNWENI